MTKLILEIHTDRSCGGGCIGCPTAQKKSSYHEVTSEESRSLEGIIESVRSALEREIEIHIALMSPVMNLGGDSSFVREAAGLQLEFGYPGLSNIPQSLAAITKILHTTTKKLNFLNISLPRFSGKYEEGISRRSDEMIDILKYLNASHSHDLGNLRNLSIIHNCTDETQQKLFIYTARENLRMKFDTDPVTSDEQSVFVQVPKINNTRVRVGHRYNMKRGEFGTIDASMSLEEILDDHFYDDSLLLNIYLQENKIYFGHAAGSMHKHPIFNMSMNSFRETCKNTSNPSMKGLMTNLLQKVLGKNNHS